MSQVCNGILFLLLLTNPVPSTAQDPGPRIEEIVHRAMKKHGVVGASLTLVDSSGIFLSKGFGYADKSLGIRATGKTIYPFGSIAKVITMASVLKLQDMGKLDIDSPFQKYVPDYRINQHFTPQIAFTIFDVLTQQAGIPRTRLKDLYTDHAGPTDFYHLIAEEKSNFLIAPPKHVYQYSDIGFTMLGLLPRYTAQVDYTDFVRREIFSPLGMSNASFHRDSARTNYTKGYEKGEEAKIFATRYLPAFGLQASSEDLAKFMYAFLNEGKSITGKQVISPEMTHRAITRQNLETRLAFSNHLGLTWWRNDFYGYTSVYHGGEQKPCLSMARMLPELNIGISLVMNTDTNGDFIAEVTEQVLLEIMKSRNIPFAKDYYKKFASKKVPQASSAENRFVGDYASSYGIISIQSRNNHFNVQLVSVGKKFRGKLMSDSTLQLTTKVLGIYPVNVMRLFVEEVDGRKIIGTKSSRTGRKIFGGEMINFEKTSTAWNNQMGIYRISNLNNREYVLLEAIEVSRYKGIIVISGEGTIPGAEKFQFCLRPMNDSLAVVQGIGGQGLLGETIKRYQKDGSEFIEIAGYAFRKDNGSNLVEPAKHLQ